MSEDCAGTKVCGVILGWETLLKEVTFLILGYIKRHPLIPLRSNRKQILCFTPYRTKKLQEITSICQTRIYRHTWADSYTLIPTDHLYTSFFCTEDELRNVAVLNLLSEKQIKQTAKQLSLVTKFLIISQLTPTLPSNTIQITYTSWLTLTLYTLMHQENTFVQQAVSTSIRNQKTQFKLKN